MKHAVSPEVGVIGLRGNISSKEYKITSYRGNLIAVLGPSYLVASFVEAHCEVLAHSEI